MTQTSQQLSALAQVKHQMTGLSTKKKQTLLRGMASEIRNNSQEILSANAQDMEKAQGEIGEVMQDRLRLDPDRIEAMAQGVEAVAKLPDPVGRILSTQIRPNDMKISKTAVAMGTIAIIYESRPNVTSDAAALALMAGSACVLRSGKEAHNTANAIVLAMKKALESQGLSPLLLTLLEDTSRESALELMTAKGQIDLLIPRGGKGLISTCVTHATVPVMETGTGICHGFVDKDANQDLALSILENAKASRPSVCNALEVCLVHQDIAQTFLPKLLHTLSTKRQENNLPPVTLKLSPPAHKLLPPSPFALLATEEDFSTEFLDYILAVTLVDSVESAIAHINAHSTGHSEVILSDSPETAQIFTNQVDSAAVYVNCSTRFTDGGEFGLGCEMGISTQKLHARGPLGLTELCSYKYVIQGTGQIR